ncbi:low specificity L-threonine aldolase [Mycobacterium paraense]|uniref:threonine aldolase family protein n=1 Tax=Mycobacterium paraense TaxID=767916 RepID=UPI000A163532|nr:low specificity L-threonine aldolase [Mycobacterium paraense]MCV7443779.1 low specificity L-threonine aldolase [Mycobacterium paraense]
MTPYRSLISDNAAGGAPEIIAAVVAAAAGQAPPYGTDSWTSSARRRFSEAFDCDVDLLPVSTGSAANALSLAALTPPWGSVLCHRDSHINNDECGAPEFFTGGAKLVALGGDNAKIDADELRAAVRRKVGDVHSAQPCVLSLTQATETGAVYTPAEIGHLASIAKHAGLRVHLDGARLANAVAALGCTPAELTWRAGVDVLSFGAIKNGSLTADAIVVFERSLTTELSFRAKRAGQLAAKMRFAAAQLDAYLADDLWLRNALHANAMTARLKKGLKSVAGVRLSGTPEANILFCRLSLRVIDGLLDQGYDFYHGRWEPGVVRFVTSFATTTDDVDGLVHAVRRLTAAEIEESRAKRARTQRSAGGRRTEVVCMGSVR